MPSFHMKRFFLNEQICSFDTVNIANNVSFLTSHVLKSSLHFLDRGELTAYMFWSLYPQLDGRVNRPYIQSECDVKKNHPVRSLYWICYSGSSAAHTMYVGHTESHEQLFFACNLGTAYEREYGGRWNQLLC
jgi:hypothetical protein